MTPHNDPVHSAERLVVGVLVAVGTGVVTRFFKTPFDAEQLEYVRAGVTVVMTSFWPNLLSLALWERRRAQALKRLSVMRTRVSKVETPSANVRAAAQCGIETIDREKVRIELLLPYNPIVIMIDGDEILRRVASS